MTLASQQTWVPAGGTSARGHRALTTRVAPGARSKPTTAAIEGRKSPGNANCVPAKGFAAKVTAKWRAVAVPRLRMRAWNQLSCPNSGAWWVVPPSSALRNHRSGESQNRPPQGSAPL